MIMLDSQTLGVIGFFSFVLLAGMGMMLVSGMKEPSYDETIASRRVSLGTTTSSGTDKKKKKDKASEKKNKGKKKEDKPNEKLQEEDDSEAEAPAAAPVENPPAPSLKKKKEKKAKVEPAPTQSAPNPAKAAPPAKAAQAATKSAPNPPKAAQNPPKAAPNPPKAAQNPPKAAQNPAKSAPAPAKAAKAVPVMAVPPVGSKQTAAVQQEPNQGEAPSKKRGSRKKEDSISDALPFKTLLSTVSSMSFSEGDAQQLMGILSDKAGTWHTASSTKGDAVSALKKQLEEKVKQLATEQKESAAMKSRLKELTKELSGEKSKMASVETRLSSQLSKREQEMNAMQARMTGGKQDQQSAKGSPGSDAQLARLQQENKILRDALTQATSHAKSEQNAELAKMRQDFAKMTKELAEKNVSMKNLEVKLAAAEKLKDSHTESEQQLQQRLDEVTTELEVVRSSSGSLQVDLKKAQQDGSSAAELRARAERVEAELKERSTQVEALNTLLDACQRREGELKSQVNSAELEQLKLSLQERDGCLQLAEVQIKKLKQAQTNCSEEESLVASLQDELKHIKDEMETLRNTPQTAGELSVLQSSLTERDALVSSLQEELSEARRQLQTSESDSLEKLKPLQTECEQYRIVLAETEGMLKELQTSVEKEEKVWKAKMEKSEEQSTKLEQLLSRSQSQLEAAQREALVQGEELATAQNTVLELQAELDRLMTDAPQDDTDDVAHLKERLEKEKKLSKDLGQAATKLQQLFKTSQDQLTKEKDTVRTLQILLEHKGERVEVKEGTSV